MKVAEAANCDPSTIELGVEIAPTTGPRLETAIDFVAEADDPMADVTVTVIWKAPATAYA